MTESTSAKVAAGAGVPPFTALFDQTAAGLFPYTQLRRLIADGGQRPADDNDPPAESGSVRHAMHRWFDAVDQFVRPLQALACACGRLP